MVSFSAKCKVRVSEPGYPTAAVSRGKQAIFGLNETFKIMSNKNTFTHSSLQYKHFEIAPKITSFDILIIKSL